MPRTDVSTVDHVPLDVIDHVIDRQHNIGAMPYAMAQPFTPCRWLTNRHAQTLWPALLRRPPAVRIHSEVMATPDGDHVQVSWAIRDHGDISAHTPVMIVLHGLEGDLDSHYVTPLLAGGLARGWRPVLLHFRGAAGRPNLLPRSYHSGDTGDLANLATLCRERYRDAPLLAVGISVGGNVLLKWLGECGDRCPIRVAVAACVPFDLARSDAALSRGFARIYQRRLVRDLVRSYRAKAHLLDVQNHEWRTLTTFRAVDARLTAPLNGFTSVDDYYQRASCRPWISRITVPTLIVGAADDPFVPVDTWPDPATTPAAVTIERHAHGGHVGFIAGPWRPHSWLEDRLLDGLAERLA